MKKQTRLLVLFVSDYPFAANLKEVGIFETPDEAFKAAMPYMNDITVKAIFINHDKQWFQIS
jgi:hypothetical protein